MQWSYHFCSTAHTAFQGDKVLYFSGSYKMTGHFLLVKMRGGGGGWSTWFPMLLKILKNFTWKHSFLGYFRPYLTTLDLKLTLFFTQTVGSFKYLINTVILSHYTSVYDDFQDYEGSIWCFLVKFGPKSILKKNQNFFPGRFSQF